MLLPHNTNSVLLQAITSQGIGCCPIKLCTISNKISAAMRINERLLIIGNVASTKLCTSKLPKSTLQLATFQSCNPVFQIQKLLSHKHKFNCFLLLNVPPLPQNYCIAWKRVNQAPVLHQHCIRLCTTTCQNKNK